MPQEQDMRSKLFTGISLAFLCCTSLLAATKIDPVNQINWPIPNTSTQIWPGVTGDGANGLAIAGSLAVGANESVNGSFGSSYIEVTGAVPFAPGNFAGVGRGLTAGEVDLVSGINDGATSPIVQFVGVNSMGTGWNIAGSVDNSGNYYANGNYILSNTGAGLQGPGANQYIEDDGGSHGWAFVASSGSTNGFTFTVGGTQVGQIDPSGNYNNSHGTLLPAAATGNTGSGNVVLSSGPTLVNPTVGTQSNSNNSTLAASTAWVRTYVSSISAGVLTINGVPGAYTFNGGGVSCSSTTCTFSTSGFANYAYALNSAYASLEIAANTCVGPNGVASPITPGTFTTTNGIGVTTPQTNVLVGWQGDPASTYGWGKFGGLTFNPWITGSDTVSYVVCNPTSAAIGTPATTAIGLPTFITSYQ